MTALAIRNEYTTNVKILKNTIEVSVDDYFIRKGLDGDTVKKYTTHINEFCQVIFGVKYQFVLKEDFAKLHLEQGGIYYGNLLDRGLKKNTIKIKLSIVRSFIEHVRAFLSVDYKDIEHSDIFLNINIDIEEDCKGSDVLSWEMSKLFIDYSYNNVSPKFAMLVKLACVTSIRLGAMLLLKWEHFYVKNEDGVDINYVKIYFKKKWNVAPISKELFNELKEVIGETDGLLFGDDYYPVKIGRELKAIVNFFDFDEREKITFHSFKKCGINRVIEKTGSLTLAQIQGMHSDLKTTQKYYMKATEKLSEMPSYTIEKDIDLNIDLQGYTKEELMRAINKLGVSAKNALFKLLV